MKTAKILLLVVVLYCSDQRGNTQIVNWNSMGETKHLIFSGIGWDYGLSYALGYGYRVNTNVPLMLEVNLSVPSGEILWDDFKTKIGGQLVILNNTNFKGSMTLNGIFRRYQNPLVRIRNFGAEIKGSVGYFNTKWFVSVDFGLDQAVFTHFYHSKSFRGTIFQNVENGWFGPGTGGNLRYGLQVGYAFKQSDLTVNMGRVIGHDFSTSLLIPYYLMLGYQYKIE